MSPIKYIIVDTTYARGEVKVILSKNNHIKTTKKARFVMHKTKPFKTIEIIFVRNRGATKLYARSIG